MKKIHFKMWAIAIVMALSTSMVNSQTLDVPTGSQKDIFTLEVDLTPSHSTLNGGVGVSEIESVAGWGEMSAIVGFTNESKIHARNGDAYQVLNAMTYEAGTSYHLLMTVDVPNMKYSATLTPEGGEETVVAYDFAFRAETDNIEHFFTHCDTNTLWGGMHGSSISILNFKVLDKPVDIEYGVQVGTFQSIPIATQDARFIAEYSIVASHDNMNAAFALSADTATEMADLSPIVRFGTSGMIDVKNGEEYVALSEYAYLKDVAYEFYMEVNVLANTYNVSVSTNGEEPVVLATDYAFGKMTEELNFRVLNVEVDAASGGIPESTLGVSNFKLSYSPAKAKINHTAVVPVIDGDISDGFWDDIETNYCLNNFSKQVSSTLDLSATWKAVWTNDSLFVMANVTDDILFDNGAPAFNTDGVHLYWGLKNNRNDLGGNATPSSTPADDAKVFSQFYYSADSSASGGEIGSWLPDVTHKIVANDTGYIFEASFSWAAINKFGCDFSATNGAKILFDLNVVDNDNDGFWSEMQWGSAQNNWANMNDAGEMELSGLNSVDGTELQAVIDSSKIAVAVVTIGDGDGEYTQDMVDAANAAIADAEAVLANATTQEEVDNATADLRAAMDLFVPNLVSVNELFEKNFAMYPNPATNQLALDNISNVSEISIFSVTGKLIENRTNTAVNMTIDVSNLNSGIYLIKFNTDKGIAAKRFIKE